MLPDLLLVSDTRQSLPPSLHSRFQVCLRALPTSPATSASKNKAGLQGVGFASATRLGLAHPCSRCFEHDKLQIVSWAGKKGICAYESRMKVVVRRPPASLEPGSLRVYGGGIPRGVAGSAGRWAWRICVVLFSRDMPTPADLWTSKAQHGTGQHGSGRASRGFCIEPAETDEGACRLPSVVGSRVGKWSVATSGRWELCRVFHTLWEVLGATVCPRN